MQHKGFTIERASVVSYVSGDLSFLLEGITRERERRRAKKERRRGHAKLGDRFDRSIGRQQSHYLLQPLKHKVNCVRVLE